MTHLPATCLSFKRLAEAKSTIIITDLPDLESLIVSIFTTFYNLQQKGSR